MQVVVKHGLIYRDKHVSHTPSERALYALLTSDQGSHSQRLSSKALFHTDHGSHGMNISALHHSDGCGAKRCKQLELSLHNQKGRSGSSRHCNSANALVWHKH